MTKRTLFPLIALATCTLLAEYASAQAMQTLRGPQLHRITARATSRTNPNVGYCGHPINHSSDVDLTKRIRQSVVADKSLSTYAHNVKIVTLNGSVTLNALCGPMKEDAVERRRSP
jgi:hypothetical protein